MKSQQLKRLKLPDEPGVYIFRDYKKRAIYIGRATSLRDRTKSYFTNDLIETRGPRIIDMVTKTKFLTWQMTDSVLEAIILENTLIKRYQPFYNVDERDDKSSQYVVITDEAWPRVFLERARYLDQKLKEGILSYRIKKCFGPYPHGGLIKEVLKILRKLFPFKDKKSLDARHDRFYQALGKSPFENDTNAHRRYLRTIKYLILFFEGKKQKIRNEVEEQMNSLAKQMRFEEAGLSRRLLYALDHINDIALIKQEKEAWSTGQGVGEKSVNKQDFRIEAYDIAHLSGTNVVGAMTVFVNGEFVRSEYRKFKISKQKNDDVAGLREIITRRLNHPEWTYPDLIVVDGNKVQMTAVEDVLKARRVEIPIVAVTKDERHKALELAGHPELILRHKKEIIAINSEAHRFVIGFHRKIRGKAFKSALLSP